MAASGESRVLVLPDRPDAELKAFVEGWSGAGAYDPRRKAGMT